MNVSADIEPVWLSLAILGTFIMVFPLLWCLVVLLLSRVGGWHRLGKRYAVGDQLVEGNAVSPAHVSVGSVRYRHITTLQLNDEGFCLSVMPLFRLGHPRLFIPYTDITTRRPARFPWLKSEVFGIGDPEITTITLPDGLISPPAGQ